MSLSAEKLPDLSWRDEGPRVRPPEPNSRSNHVNHPDRNFTRLSRLSMRAILAPAGVMPMKSDAFAKKSVRPSEAHSTAFHALEDVVADSSVPKGD
jgi:hypothetical protein